MADGGADKFCDTSATADVSTDFTNDTGCNGAVNPAFEDTEGLKSSDSKDTNGGEAKKSEENNHSTNGELKSPTKDGLPPAEAVNLEMVTMSPYTNSIPVKKESTELDMTDPYDEYFVPVNQHKKYIRGEKLYVTQDKRENLAGSKKKCFCGFIAVLVIGAAIAILVAVLLTQENANLPEGEARNYDKAGFGSKIIPTFPARSPPSQPPPTTDMSQIYLRNVLEGELTIDNMGFTPGLSNSSSSEFNTLAISLEEEIKKALFDHQKLHYGASEISVKVIEFRSGSVIVTYRVGWRFKEGSDNPSDPIDMEMLKTKLQKHLKENDGCLYNYRIPVSSIKSTRVIDNCQIDNNGCSKGCNFNATTLRITCTCPYGLILADDEKTCVEMNQMETHGFDYPHHMVPSEPVESSPEPEKPHDDVWSNEDHNDSSEGHNFGHHDDFHHEHGHDHSNDNEPEHEFDKHEHHEHGGETSSVHPVEETSSNNEESSHDHHPDHDFNMENHFDIPESPPVEDNFSHSTEPAHLHPSDSNNHTMEYLPDYSIETQSGKQPHDHTEDSSHEPSSGDDSMHSLFPAASEKPDEASPEHESSIDNVEPVMNSTEVKGYLPEPSMMPDHDDREPSSDNAHSPKDQISEHSGESDKSDGDSDSAGLLPPLVNNSSESHMPPEYLPEYSTFADSPQETNTTENSIKLITTEATHIEPHVAVNNIEDSEVTQQVDKSISHFSNSQEQPSSTEGFKEPSTSEEFPIISHKHEEGEMPLETNISKNTTSDGSREELIDHMPEMGKDKLESGSTTAASVETDLKTSEKPSNYPEVVNDIHTIEGNPYETERLNELPPSNESMSEGKDPNSVLNPTEKPIEHNAIETFREAKATDYNNSTSGENEGNSTHMEMIEDSHKLNEMPGENADNPAHNNVSSSGIPSDSAIFVTPAPSKDEENAANLSDETKESTAEVAGSSDESSLEDKKEVEDKAQVNKDTDTPSTEVANSSNDFSNISDDAKLMKTTEGNESPKVEDYAKVREILPSMNSDKDDKEITTTRSEESSDVTTMKPHDIIGSVPQTIESDSEKELSKKHDENVESPIYVTHPPDSAEHLDKKHSSPKEDEMPMISVTKIPDLMGPFTVDTEIKGNPELEEEQKVVEKPQEKPDINKLLDDESNNLNSLEDDYDNDNLKGKSKLLKNFNVKEIYTHHNSSEKNIDKVQSSNSEHLVEVSVSSSTTEGIKEPVNPLLSDEGYNTPSPLFTSKDEPSSIPSSTTAKSEETSKEIKSDQGLISSEAYTTIQPLFHQPSSDQPTTLKVEEITPTTPLIFDLFEGKKVDAKLSEFESVATTIQPDKASEHDKEITTVLHEVDLMSETTPALINPDVESATESVKSVKEDHTEVSDDMSTMPPEISQNAESTKEEEVKPSEPVSAENVEKSSETSSDDKTEKSSDTLSTETDEKSTKPASNDMIESSTKPDSDDKTETSTDLASDGKGEKVSETNSDKISEKSASGNETSETETPAQSSLEKKSENLAESKTEMTTEESVTFVPTTLPSVMPLNEASSEVSSTENPMTISSTEATHAEIKDPVVKLLMNSTLSNICASGQWTCLDGSGCIAPNSRCDSVHDCKDGSDEASCQENGCPNNYQCKSGECLKRSLVCDSTPDCKDGSDELNCDSWQCNFDEMQCSSMSKKCIPTVWKCDNIPHCPNNEDEFNCKDSCQNDEFLCPEGWCLSLAKKCDGTPDCAKGEDENNC